MTQTTTLQNANLKNAYRYIMLETGIAYDWDDYSVWGSVLYDVVDDKIITDKYGHGTAGMDGCTVEEAVSAGVITIEHMIDVMVNELGISFDHADIPSLITRYSIENPLGIPVEVIGGRKFKGAGYLVGSIEEPVRYGLGRYQGAVNYRYLIFSPEKNDYFTINSFRYVKLADEIIEAWNVAARKSIENTADNVRHLAHAWAYKMSYSACDTRNYHSMIKRYSNKGIASIATPEILIQAAANRAEQKRIARENQMNAELPSLIEWVRSKGYKNTEEEIIAEAKRIWNKNH